MQKKKKKNLMHVKPQNYYLPISDSFLFTY